MKAPGILYCLISILFVFISSTESVRYYVRGGYSISVGRRSAKPGQKRVKDSEILAHTNFLIVPGYALYEPYRSHPAIARIIPREILERFASGETGVITVDGDVTTTRRPTTKATLPPLPTFTPRPTRPIATTKATLPPLPTFTPRSTRSTAATRFPTLPTRRPIVPTLPTASTQLPILTGRPNIPPLPTASNKIPPPPGPSNRVPSSGASSGVPPPPSGGQRLPPLPRGQNNIV